MKRMCLTDNTMYWDRFRNDCRDMGYVGVFEKPNTEIMKMLLDSYMDDPNVIYFAELLAGKRRAVLDGDGQQYQEYVQKDLTVFAPEDYHGSTKIGRAYTNSLFQRLYSPILNTIYKTTHVGVDMCSSYSTMLTNAFRDLDLGFFNLYVNSPDVVYDAFAEAGFGRAAVKKLVNGGICSWPAPYEDAEWGEMAEFRRMEMVARMRSDLDKMAGALRQRYPGFYEMVRRKCEGEGRLQHVDGTALFYLASDMEHAAMRVVLAHLYGGRHLSDVVWKYDGIIIPMSTISGRRHDEVLADLERVVKEKLDLVVRFKIDDLAANSFGICIAPEDRDAENGLDAYERWKVRFEREFAVLKNPPVFMMFQRGGKTWVDLNKAGFEHVTATENQEFIKRWHTDPSKRMYQYRDFLPPPLACPDGVLNTWKGMAAADLPEVHGVDISMYLRHVDLLMGNLNGEHPEYSEYMHNLLGFKFQRPGEKLRKMVVIVSTQGTGKDVWFDFLATLFGEHMCVKGNSISDFVDKKSGKLEGKIMCCFQEMGTRKGDKECEEQLKTYITNKHLPLERKHVNEIIVTNVVDFIGFTNKMASLQLFIDSDDRRFFPVVADGTHAQDDAYMLPLLAWFQEDRNKRAVYQFYMERDVSGFNPSSHCPKTHVQSTLKEASASPLEVFLKRAIPVWMQSWEAESEGLPMSKRSFVVKDGRLFVRASVVSDHWLAHAEENGFEKHKSRDAMMRFFTKLVNDMLVRTDKFKSEGVDVMVEKVKFGGGVRAFAFDHHGLMRYVKHLLPDGDEDVDQEPPAKRKRGELRARYNPKRNPLYQVLEAGEVVFESNDLEEINKAMGEAYICPLRGVLVHQHRNNMEIDISDIWVGDHKWAKVEQKYPFYVRDRTG